MGFIDNEFCYEGVCFLFSFEFPDYVENDLFIVSFFVSLSSFGLLKVDNAESDVVLRHWLGLEWL